MKKALFILTCVLVMGATLTSCNKDKQRCFKVTYNMPNGSSAVVYRWSTINLMEIEKKRLENTGYTEVKFTMQTKYTTVEECTAQNIK